MSTMSPTLYCKSEMSLLRASALLGFRRTCTVSGRFPGRSYPSCGSPARRHTKFRRAISTLLSCNETNPPIDSSRNSFGGKTYASARTKTSGVTHFELIAGLLVGGGVMVVCGDAGDCRSKSQSPSPKAVDFSLVPPGENAVALNSIWRSGKTAKVRIDPRSREF